MGKHFALTFQLPMYGRTARPQAGSIKKKMNSIKFRTDFVGMAVLVLLVGSVLGYLIQVNNFSTKGYEINRLQSQLTALQEQHDKLQVQAAEAQSIQRIQNDPAVLNMVPTGQMTYIQSTALTQR